MDRTTVPTRRDFPVACLTGDTFGQVETVTVRDLRNRGADVLDRVSGGQEFVVTRDGRPVAELRPVRGRSTPTAELIARRAALPHVDPDAMRADLDDHVDPSL